MEQSLSKKLRGSDGLPMAVGIDTSQNAVEGTIYNASQMFQHDVSLTDGSSGNIGVENAERLDGAQSEQIRDIDGGFAYSILGKAKETPTIISQNRMPIVNFTGQVEDAGNNTGCVVSAGVLPYSLSALDEKQLKRERRKQANRESARKSRVKKQTEYEELVNNYDSLKMENDSLKSELVRLNADTEKLRQENAALMEKLEVSGGAQRGETALNSVEVDSTVTKNTENEQNKSDNSSRILNLDPKRSLMNY